MFLAFCVSCTCSALVSTNVKTISGNKKVNVANTQEMVNSKEKEYKPVTHCIFDMDGLILNTGELYTEANDTVLKRYGKTFCWEIKIQQMGRKKRDAIATLLRYYNLDITIDEYAVQLETELDNLFPHSKLLPGAERLILHLHKHKVPIALCSGSISKNYYLKIKEHGAIFSLFDPSVLGDDPELIHGKPAPDCFLLCASRFKVPPAAEHVLVFEDAPNGVKAALAANMQVVMVPDPRVDKHIRETATLDLDSLIHFKPELFRLPKFE